MPDAAVVLYNEAGDLLVDSRNVNMFLRYSGVTGGDRFNNVVVNCFDPVLFFRPVSEYGGVEAMFRNGGEVTYRFRGQCEYYIFDRPWKTGGPIDIWSQDGTHIFMSTARPMNVLQTIDLPNYFDAYRQAYLDGWTYSGLPTSKYAYNVSFTRQGYDCSPMAGGGWSSWLCNERIVATPNGLQARFPEYGMRFLGWAPLNSNVFVSYAGACPVSFIDVAGWL
jgi:hypothetical protein